MTETDKCRYANSKIYKLIDDEGYFYWGSTCMALHKRYFSHKRKSKREPERKIYTVFTHSRFLSNEIKIVLEKQVVLSSKEELLREEDRYIQQSIDDNKCLNSIHAVMNYEKRKESQQISRKNYSANNKEKIHERDKIYYKENIEQILQYQRNYRTRNTEKLKEYRENAKERYAENHQLYVERNPDRIKEINDRYEKKRVTCCCGSDVKAHCYNKHLQSQKHILFMEKEQMSNKIQTPLPVLSEDN